MTKTWMCWWQCNREPTVASLIGVGGSDIEKAKSFHSPGEIWFGPQLKSNHVMKKPNYLILFGRNRGCSRIHWDFSAIWRAETEM
jgi:hypothetical protein